MQNEMYWDEDPNLPIEVNNCITLLLLVFSWPPIYRTEVRTTIGGTLVTVTARAHAREGGWSAAQLEEVSDWAAAMYARASDNDVAVPPEPDILFDLRRRCAAMNKRELPTRYEAMREQERARP